MTTYAINRVIVMQHWSMNGSNARETLLIKGKMAEQKILEVELTLKCYDFFAISYFPLLFRILMRLYPLRFTDNESIIILLDVYNL